MCLLNLFRTFVEYKNVNTLYFRIIKSDEKLKELLSKRYDNEYWNTLINHSAIKNWEQTLPDTKDLQEHATEIKIDALQPGEYILLASDNKNFSNAKALLGARYFYVSSISFVSNQQDYFVLNRDNGQPIANAKVQVWKQQYDYNVSKYIKVKDKLYTTNDKGYFKMEEPKTEKNRYNNTYLFEINSRDERLFLDEGISSYYFYNQKTEAPKEITTAYLFTDRSLYRPGQTVYFKAIVLKGNTNSKNSIVNPNFSTKLVLRDANYQVVDTLRLITNEFGSVNGKFQLPQTGMNGQFSISIEKVNGGNTQFRVEEYKRPKFYVDYEPIKGTYKVNDKITVTGTAKAYAGNNIDGANVKYRVVRQPRFIYDWFFWRWWMPPTEEMEITNGEVKTDKDGKFIISFTAIPDNKIDKKFDPVFDYHVYADVTDINGETRSGETSVSVSYKSMMLVAQIPSSLPADSLKNLHITTQNMNGEFEPSTINLTITKLNDEKRLIRKRFWERPDQFVMSKQDYISYFPYDEYDNETDFKSWTKSQTLVNKQDTAKKEGSFALGTAKFSPGIYVIEMQAKNKTGEEVKDVKYLELTDESSKQLNRPQYIWTGINKTLIEPGETARIELGTAADNLFVVQLLNKQKADKQNTTEYSFLTLNNQKQTFSFNTTEADRGGFGVGWMFIKHNRFYQQDQTIQVPWTNKDLNIEYVSFRDKTLPGSDEKWKVKISGNKKEKLAAEMLASMYDASLDQFYPHSWNKPYVWSNFYSNTRWNENSNFSTVSSQTKYVQETESKNLYKVYDFLFPAVILSSNYRGSIEPLWWDNPLNYAYSEVRNPRLMRLPKDGRMEMMKSSMPAPTEAAGMAVTDSVS